MGEVSSPCCSTVLPQDMRLSAAKHHRLSEVNSPRKLFPGLCCGFGFQPEQRTCRSRLLLTRPSVTRGPRQTRCRRVSSRSPRTLRPWVVLTSGWVSI